jgi:hypothetical protein
VTIAERLLRWAVAGLAGSVGEIARALVAELAVVPDGAERRRWVLGGYRMLGREAVRALGSAAVSPGVLLVCGIVVGLDHLGRSDDAGQVVLAALLAGSALLGAARPEKAWARGLVVGAAVCVSHLGILLLSGSTAATSTLAHAGTLIVLVVPALLAAGLGAAGRRSVMAARGP